MEDVVELPYRSYEKIKEFFNELDNFIADLEKEKERFKEQSERDMVSKVLSYHYSKIIRKLNKLKEMV